MKYISRIIPGFILSLLFASQALAQHTGPYVGIYGGGNILATGRSADGKGKFFLDYDPAPQGGVVVGYDLETGHPLGNGRIEIEYSRRSNGLKTARLAEGKVNASGDLTVDAVMINCFGVPNTDDFWAPYFGVGVGAARLAAEKLKITGTPFSNDTDYAFAYQAGVGLDFNLSKHFSLDVGYRFLGTTRPRFKESSGIGYKTDYYSNSAVIGLRYGF